jgi:hypothetical protein
MAERFRPGALERATQPREFVSEILRLSPEKGDAVSIEAALDKLIRQSLLRASKALVEHREVVGVRRVVAGLRGVCHERGELKGRDMGGRPCLHPYLILSTPHKGQQPSYSFDLTRLMASRLPGSWPDPSAPGGARPKWPRSPLPSSRGPC